MDMLVTKERLLIEADFLAIIFSTNVDMESSNCISLAM